MQNKKSKVLVIALIVSLVAIISLGSLAWFTAKDDVTNTIKLADNFEITVFEHDFNDPNTPETKDGVTYTNIMPGQTISKDPTVRNTGKHPEWVRVKVTLNHYDDVWVSAIQAGEDSKIHLENIFLGYNDAVWDQDDGVKVSSDGKNVTLTFYLRNVLQPYNDTDNNQVTLFNKFVVPSELDNDDLKTITESNEELTITVTAEAIQSEYLGESVTKPQQAFAKLADVD